MNEGQGCHGDVLWGGMNGGLKVAKYGKRPSFSTECMQSYDVEGRGGGVPKLVGKRVYQGKTDRAGPRGDVSL